MAGPRPSGGKGGKKPGGAGKPERPVLKKSTVAAALAQGATFLDLEDTRLLAMLANAEAQAELTPGSNLNTVVAQAIAEHRGRPPSPPRNAPPRVPKPETVALAISAGATLVEANSEKMKAMLMLAEDAHTAEPTINLRALVAKAINDLREQAAQDSINAQQNSERELLKLQSEAATARAHEGHSLNQSRKQSIDFVNQVVGMIVTAIVVGAILYFFVVGGMAQHR